MFLTTMFLLLTCLSLGNSFAPVQSIAVMFILIILKFVLMSKCLLPRKCVVVMSRYFLKILPFFFFLEKKKYQQNEGTFRSLSLSSCKIFLRSDFAGIFVTSHSRCVHWTFLLFNEHGRFFLFFTQWWHNHFFRFPHKFKFQLQSLPSCCGISGQIRQECAGFSFLSVSQSEIQIFAFASQYPKNPEMA